jgi:hypothetical protein
LRTGLTIALAGRARHGTRRSISSPARVLVQTIRPVWMRRQARGAHGILDALLAEHLHGAGH